MKTVLTVITNAGKVIFQGAVTLTERPNEWGGYFTPMPGLAIDVGDRCQLKLEDGRTGEISITDIEPGSGRRPVVRFDGDGALG